MARPSLTPSKGWSLPSRSSSALNRQPLVGSCFLGRLSHSCNDAHHDTGGVSRSPRGTGPVATLAAVTQGTDGAGQFLTFQWYCFLFCLG